MDEILNKRPATPVKTNEDPLKKQGMPVDKERLQEFGNILQKYKAGKAHLEKRVVQAEQWWKLRNESEERKKGIGWNEDFRAKSGWLHNVIVSKHADAMESYPEPLVLPREPGDREMATTLSAVLPVILEQNQFEKTYDQAMWQKLKTGTGVYKVWWDADKLNGLGDVAIRRVDLLGLFWEPGITDIQNSRYFFHCELRDNEILEEEYPQLKDKLNGASMTLTKFVFEDNVSTEGKSLVIDVYYKKTQDKRTVLHYCKYVNDEVLYSTENEELDKGADRYAGMMETPAQSAMPMGQSANPAPMAPMQQAPMQQAPMPGAAPGMMPGMMPSTPWPVEPEHFGLYDHGLYPFVFDPLWPVEGSPCGYGYVDLCMNTQIQLDMLDTAFIKNAMAGATPRYFSRLDAAVNEEEFKDINRSIVHVSGTLDETGIRPIDYSPLAGNYINFYSQKITELRETSGNTESANGIYSGGVTAASSIAALQEASGKTSRDSSRASYRAFGEMSNMIIELIRQFYDLPRTFRIKGEGGQEAFATVDNSMMQPEPIGIGTQDMGFRLPVYDVRVEVQKRNAYTRTSQNELALQLFNLGFFNPQFSTPALSCLDMMDFDGKDELMQSLRKNGTIYDQLQQVSQLLMQMAQKYEPQNAQALAASLGMVQPAAAGGGGRPVDLKSTETGENSIVANARERSNQAANPEK
ncbi:MAG: hypothetical protein J6W82_05130 [Bacteroidales bacterium]|nr:hypothetical protein [Bacteroidales bacterium]